MGKFPITSAMHPRSVRTRGNEEKGASNFRRMPFRVHGRARSQ